MFISINWASLWLNELWFKRYIQKCTLPHVIKMHPVSCNKKCTLSHHGVTDLVNHGMVKNTKTYIYWERNITFLQNKKILNLWLRGHRLRSYRFVAEVTFNMIWPVRSWRLTFLFGTGYAAIILSIIVITQTRI